MTHDQAVAEAERLGREHPDRGRVSWLAREGEPGEWRVVRVGFAPHAAAGGTPTVQPPPEPPQEGPDRPPIWLTP
jgi:hypothetical protein